LCYRCPLEEDCRWAKKVFRKIETEYLYSVEERGKNCPLKKVLEV